MDYINITRGPSRPEIRGERDRKQPAKERNQPLEERNIPKEKGDSLPPPGTCEQIPRSKRHMFLMRSIEMPKFGAEQKVSPESLNQEMISDELKRSHKEYPDEQSEPVEWTNEALLPTLRLASSFGLLPVSVKKSRKPVRNKCITFNFSWLSPLSLGTLFLLLCIAIIEFTAVQYLFNGFYYSTKLETFELTTSGAAFYGYSFISTLLCLRLATRWKCLAKTWHTSEAPLLLNKGEFSSFSRLKSSQPNMFRKQPKIHMKPKIFPASLKGRFALLTAIILSLALAEHLWHVIVRIVESWNEVMACSTEPNSVDTHLTQHVSITTPASDVNSTSMENPTVFYDKRNAGCLKTIYTIKDNFALKVLENFSRRSHWFVYEQTSYATWKALALVGVSLVATFIWNFTDIFIMILSMALSTRFKQLNAKLESLRGKELRPSQWEGLRCQYASLSRLSGALDDHINGLTFFSIASNLYFICIQLLSGLHAPPHTTMEKTAFYFFSFFFLVGRAAGVILIASSINQETLNLPKHLYACPRQSYCKEVQRFMTELTTDFVALSGLNLFNITRNFLLGVAGAVVTYEFVLLQLEATDA